MIKPDIDSKLHLKLKFFCAYAIITSIIGLMAHSPFHSNFAHAYADTSDEFDRGDIAELFDLGSGIFAGLLFALSLIAYRKLRVRRILFVSIAFGLFAVRTIVTRLDIFVPEIESSILELSLAIMSFIALALFFVAIVKKEKVAARSPKV